MKRLPLILIAALALPMLAKAQTQVMVGDTTAIQYTSLPISANGCVYTALANVTLQNNKDFFVAAHESYVICVPTKKGNLYDVVSYIAGMPTQSFCKPNMYSTKSGVSAIGIDSVTTISIKYPTVIIPIDTQKKEYSNLVDVLSLYNNVADTTLFHDWELVVDPASGLSFSVDSGGAAITSYEEQPFTRKKQLLIRFSTTLMPADTARTFTALFRTHALKAGKDTVYERDMTFIMPAMPQSGVKSEPENAMALTISPNPSHGDAVISVALDKPEAIEVAIFDLLGNKRSEVANGFYPNSVNQFHIDTKQLSEGSYFVRLQVGERVMTKRLVVQ